MRRERARLQQKAAGRMSDDDRLSEIESAETVAQAFHAAYEDLAPLFGYRTREASAKPWAEVPEKNRELMTATVLRLLDNGVISATASAPHGRHPE